MRPSIRRASARTEGSVCVRQSRPAANEGRQGTGRSRTPGKRARSAIGPDAQEEIRAFSVALPGSLIYTRLQIQILQVQFLSLQGAPMAKVIIRRDDFQQDRQGRTFADVLGDREQPFEQVLAFFNDQDRQRRMLESELHHNRPPLAGVVRELESQPDVDRFLATREPRRTKRLRQAVGVVVRMIMERRGWRTTGKKGSLGVRATRQSPTNVPGAYHNTGGLAFWFLRAERYELPEGMPFRSVRARRNEFESRSSRKSSAS